MHLPEPSIRQRDLAFEQMTDLLPDRREAALDPLLDHWEEVAQLNSLPKKDPLGFIQEEEYLDDAAQGPSTPILAALEHLQEPDTKPKAAESNPAESNAAEPKATKPEKRRASESLAGESADADETKVSATVFFDIKVSPNNNKTKEGKRRKANGEPVQPAEIASLATPEAPRKAVEREKFQVSAVYLILRLGLEEPPIGDFKSVWGAHKGKAVNSKCEFKEFKDYYLHWFNGDFGVMFRNKTLKSGNLAISLKRVCCTFSFRSNPYISYATFLFYIDFLGCSIRQGRRG
eukprot:m.297563 g.297563  ORF g.297563 m.297563 type:complete len:290 (-) comp55166_c0_seq33:359-1228(-)